MPSSCYLIIFAATVLTAISLVIQGWHTFAHFQNLYLHPDEPDRDQFSFARDDIYDFCDYGYSLIIATVTILGYVAATYTGHRWDQIPVNHRGLLVGGTFVFLLVVAMISRHLGASLRWRKIQQMSPEEREKVLYDSIIIHHHETGWTPAEYLAAIQMLCERIRQDNRKIQNLHLEIADANREIHRREEESRKEWAACESDAERELIQQDLHHDLAGLLHNAEIAIPQAIERLNDGIHRDQETIAYYRQHLALADQAYHTAFLSQAPSV